MEGGTLYQLRNLINRRNISKKVKGNMNEVEDFLVLVISCHLCACAMNYFGMKKNTDEPSLNCFPVDISTLPIKKRKEMFFKKLDRIIELHVISRQKFADILSPNPGSDTVTEDPHAASVLGEHLFSNMCTQTQQKHRKLPSYFTKSDDKARAPTPVMDVAADGIFNYASAVLNDGLLFFEFKDAIREGDGERVLRCWRILLLYFHAAGHKNYFKEAVHLLALVRAAATTRVAMQIKQSRFINSSGKKGGNIPIDLHCEHYIRQLKDMVLSLGANVTSETILQCGMSLKGLLDVTHNFDQQHSLHKKSTTHSQASNSKDREIILDELTKSRVFDYIPGRVHRNFKSIKPCISMTVNTSKLLQALEQHKKSISQSITTAKLFGHSF